LPSQPVLSCSGGKAPLEQRRIFKIADFAQRDARIGDRKS